MKYKEKAIKHNWLHWGTLNGFHLGIQIDRGGWDINLGVIYLGMEYGTKNWHR